MTGTLEDRVIGVLEALDEMGNAMLPGDLNIPAAGNPHYTISQRLGEMILYGTPAQQRIGKAADDVLTAIQTKVFGVPVMKSHCLDALQGMPVSLPDAG